MQNILTIYSLQNIEISLNHLIQQTLKFAEPLWIFLSEHFSAAQIIDVFVPLVGAFHHHLLVRLVCSLSIVNVLNSLMKWSSPEYRPYWWQREHQENYNASSSSPMMLLEQHSLTCETTAGFPSSHSMSFTTFLYLVIVFSFSYLSGKLHIAEHYLNLICHISVVLLSLSMWLSRMYLATEFLHQCFFGSVAAISLLHFFDRHSTFLYTLSRRTAVLLVLILGSFPVFVYFSMLRMNWDPHWSVRMAFKWCSDPSYLRHEASPIFVLGRDFGYLMGVALSTPMYKRYECKISLRKRIPFFLIIEMLNFFARQETPKQHGRFIFVAYEFVRNILHSYTLLTILSKIS